MRHAASDSHGHRQPDRDPAPHGDADAAGDEQAALPAAPGDGAPPLEGGSAPLGGAAAASPPQPGGGSSLVAPTATVTLFTIAASAASALNLAIVAALFGTGSLYGYYLAASTLPNLLMLVITAALPNTFLPIFLRTTLRDGEAEAWRMTSRVLAAVAIGLAGISVALYAATPWLIGGGVLTHGPDFAPGGRGFEITVLMLRLQLPNLLLAGIAGTLTGLHLARRSFTRPAAGPFIQSVAMLACIVLLHRRLGILALAVGSVAGPLLQTAWLAPVLRGGYRPTLDPRHPGVPELVGQVMPITGARLAGQGADLIQTRAASAIPGALPILGIANLLSDRLTNVLSQGVALTTFPDLSEAAVLGERSRFRARFSLATRFMLLVILPATLGLLVLRERLIALLFQRGRFTALDTVHVGLAFSCYLGALFATAVGKVASSALYAHQRTRTLAGVALSGTLLYVGLTIVLPRLTSPPYLGLALAWSITSAFNLVVTLLLLRRHTGPLDGARILVSSARMLLASGLMAVLVAFLDGRVAGRILVLPAGLREAALALELVVLGVLGGAIYLATLRLLGATEPAGLLAAARRLRLAPPSQP